MKFDAKFNSVGMIDNIWVVNMEAFWDPPSNPIGEVTSYVVRLQYERSPGRFVSLHTSRISDPAVRQWKPDPFPSQRPLYFQVQSVEHMNMCWLVPDSLYRMLLVQQVIQTLSSSCSVRNKIKAIRINDRVQIIGNHSFLQVRASSSAGLGPWSKQVLLGRYTLDTGGQQPSVSYFVLGFKNAFIHSSAN